MRIAQRDRRILILKAAFTENEAGEQEVAGWDEFAMPWAAYQPVSDGERQRAAAVEQKTDARFQVLWTAKLAAVTGAFRIRFQGDDWRITGVKEIGYRDRLEFTAWRLMKGAD